MKKSIFTKVSFLLIFSGFCSAQAVENAAEESSALISIDEIAQELESEEALPDVSVEEVIEEEVFDSDKENEAAASESLLLPVNDKAWRGKTAVAAENEFPKGIFAMAKGYFPGDTLNVINSKTQKTTNVLIIGSIDQYDDIGIKFSAEAAAEIKITDKTDANVILDERKNPPEMREVASAKLVIFGQDENDYSAFSQPVSIAEDEKILTAEADAVEEVAVKTTTNTAGLLIKNVAEKTVTKSVEKMALESTKEIVETGIKEGTKRIIYSATKQAAVSAASEGGEQLIISGTKESVKTITETIIVKQGGRTWIVNLGKAVPFVGALISGIMNTYSTAALGNRLVNKFDEEFDNNQQIKVDLLKGRIYGLLNIIQQMNYIINDENNQISF